jgi:hypothetical protein
LKQNSEPVRQSLFLLVVAGTCLFSSCKKDNNTPNTGTSYFPKTYTENVQNAQIGNSVTTYDLTYDGNNRLISLTSIPAPPVLSFVYAYPSNSSVTMDLYDNGELSIHEIFWLNSSSMVDSTFQYDDSQDTTTEKYIYNSNKKLVQLKTYDYFSTGPVLDNTTTYTYDVNGNESQSTDDQGNTTSYSYYTNYVNNLSVGQPYIQQSVNLVKTVTLVTPSYTETGTHFYTFDNSNRIIADSAVTGGYVVSTGIKTYTY